MLDTHVFLWWDDDSDRIGIDMRRSISAMTNRIYVSVASTWEIAIKKGKGHLDFHGSISKAILDNGFSELPINSRHAERAGALPLHHGDHFDRLLIAQAIEESLVLVTYDRKLGAYGVPILGEMNP